MDSTSPAPGTPPESTGTAEPARRSSFFPAITDMESARKAGKQGAWAAFFGAGVTAVIATIAAFRPQATAAFGIGVWAFLDAAVFLGLGVGIWRMSRTCAVLGLAFYALERIVMALDRPATAGKGIVLVVILVLAYVNGIRGTFAFHRFKKALVPPPITTEPVTPR